MLACAICHSPSLVGTLFCPQCGARLSLHIQANRGSLGLEKEAARKPVEATSIPPPASIALAGNPASPPMTTDFLLRLTLRVARQEIPLALSSSTELTLGRVDTQGQAVLPDIDLNTFGGYELGVSRIHASLQLEQDQISITDLGSANGTCVNGRRLEPYTPCLLADGDRLRFGRLDAIVYYLPSASTITG